MMPSNVDPEYERIQAICHCIRQASSLPPDVGVILGSGLGGLIELIEIEYAVDYGDLPSFPRTTAIGHAGRLCLGRVGDVPLVAFQGRFHLYEGRSPRDVILPVRLMDALGARALIVSNAAGGLHPHFRRGELTLIEDHINLMFSNPLMGENDERWGPRFPDMSAPYCPDLRKIARETARQQNIVLHEGVYAGVKGPNYETRAEYRFLRRIGADVVGMSTVPEVIAAVHSGMAVLGLSVVTNECRPDRLATTSGDEVIAAANDAAMEMRRLVAALLPHVAKAANRRASH